MSKINSYDELLAERRRLENQISEQRLAMKNDFNELKSKLEPFLNLVPIMNIFQNKKTSHPLLNSVTSLGIDLLGQRLLSKTSWITRVIIPLIAKVVTSRVISKDTVSNNSDVRSLDQ